MHQNPTIYAPCPQLERLRDARLILEIDCAANPFLDAQGRKEIRQAKRAAWVVLAAVCEQLVSTLDTAAGDPDLEDATDLEDENIAPWTLAARDGPGCEVADGGEDEHDREDIDEREREEGL
jgi:hypothetical protein